MFKEGMALVEETAAYLDGEGRREARLLARNTSLAYASESMRLTTRLMQLASWLLMQRSVNNGDMTQAEANRERVKVKLGGLSTATEGATWEGLPKRLQLLIHRSLGLEQRVVLLNEALCGVSAAEAPNAVQRDLGRIAAAFTR
jgi:regulator of CtrA degradation